MGVADGNAPKPPGRAAISAGGAPNGQLIGATDARAGAGVETGGGGEYATGVLAIGVVTGGIYGVNFPPAPVTNVPVVRLISLFTGSLILPGNKLSGNGLL